MRAPAALAAAAAAAIMIASATAFLVVPSRAPLTLTTSIRLMAMRSSSPKALWAAPPSAEPPEPEQQPSPLLDSTTTPTPQRPAEVDMSTGLWPTESRQLLALLGALGAAETAFLSYQKLVVGDLTALCSLGGGGLSARCGDVLNSEYASFLGVPLTLPAMLAYGTVAFLAVRPLLLPEGSRERAEADLASRDPLLVRMNVCVCIYNVMLMVGSDRLLY